MDSFRLPLQESEEPRDIAEGKDGFSSNVLYDRNKNGTVFATKRPGLTAYAEGQGRAQGIFYLNGQVFAFYGPDFRDVITVTRLTGSPSIVQGGDVYVGLDYSDSVLVSSDGVIWLPVFLPTFVSRENLAWTGTQFIIWSTNWADSGNTPVPEIIVSTDGETWTSITFSGTLWPAPNSFVDLDVCAGGGGYSVATTGQTNAFIWTDGSSVSAGELSNVNDTIIDLCWTGTEFLALTDEVVGTNYKIYASSDGLTWSERGTVVTGDFEDSAFSYTSIAYLDGVLYALGDKLFESVYTTVIAKSEDNGATWSFSLVPDIENHDGASATIYFNRGRIRANSTHLCILMPPYDPNPFPAPDFPIGYTSPDGINWTKITFPEQVWGGTEIFTWHTYLWPTSDSFFATALIQVYDDDGNPTFDQENYYFRLYNVDMSAPQLYTG